MNRLHTTFATLVTLGLSALAVASLGSGLPWQAAAFAVLAAWCSREIVRHP